MRIFSRVVRHATFERQRALVLRAEIVAAIGELLECRRLGLRVRGADAGDEQANRPGKPHGGNAIAVRGGTEVLRPAEKRRLPQVRGWAAAQKLRCATDGGSAEPAIWHAHNAQRW